MNLIYIDDDAANRAVMKALLATAGLQMAEAPDATNGLLAVERGAYDIVLMDLRMPQMSGLTAIRQLRARSDEKRRLPIVVVTADLTPGVQELCEAAGADAFLPKPIALDKLFRALGTVLAARGNVSIN